jgi:hypothetical protein
MADYCNQRHWCFAGQQRCELQHSAAAGCRSNQLHSRCRFNECQQNDRGMGRADGLWRCDKCVVLPNSVKCQQWHELVKLGYGEWFGNLDCDF